MTNRHFLDWSEPCLPAASAWIINALNEVSDACDLSDVVCLTPGRRAGRQLLHVLADQCGQAGLFLQPPRCLTPGALVDVVTETAVEQPLASMTERMFAWAEALRRAETETIGELVSVRPADDDLNDWCELGKIFVHLHDELAGGRRHFGDVAEFADGVETLFAEARRWRALDTIHRDYLAILEQTGLDDPHVARERILSRGIVTPNPTWATCGSSRPVCSRMAR